MFKTTLYSFDKYTFPFFEKYTITQNSHFHFNVKNFSTIWQTERQEVERS